jgi:hypothetical protein
VGYFNYISNPLNHYLRSVAKTVASKMGFVLLYDKFLDFKDAMNENVNGVSAKEKEVQLFGQ